jgi:hypothetical protein
MNAVVFDTHGFVKRLTAAGMPVPQAEALADEQMRLIDERLATKEDIAKLQASTAADIAKLQATARADIADAKAEILKWFIGTVSLQTIVILGAVVALARVVH